jgi:aryl-alcohol dehydrogenase-like predicted oxidoreductase
MTNLNAAGTFTIGANSSDPITFNRFGFGAMRITGPGVWDMPTDQSNALDVLRKSVELGVDFIDTADSYGPESSEILIKQALHPYGKVVIATKAGLTRQGPDQWSPVGHPNYLRQCLELSLRRLGVDTIDLYQLHRIDDSVPLADQLGVFADAQAAGKIRHIGISEVTVDQYRECAAIVKIATVQNLYNVANRQAEPLLKSCQADGVGFIPWFPIGGKDLASADSVLNPIAERTGFTSAQLALAWLLHHSDNLIPIPGTASLAHLAENCDSAQITLDAQTLSELDQIAAQ